MNEETRHKGLGRGLSALLGEENEDYATLDRARSGREVPIESLRPNPNQPRRRFDDGEINSLADSIRAHGVLQPILVRRARDGSEAYEIVAGERRWRAAQRAQLHQVPVLVKDLTDARVVEIALVENVQREDLTAIEEANAFKRLMGEFGHTQEQLSQAIGKSRSHIANTLRLLALPESVKILLEDGQLTAGHARALLGVTNAEALAQRIVLEGMSVRAAEALAQAAAIDGGKPRRERRNAAPAKDAETVALEKQIASALGLKVEIRHQGDGGEVRIQYGSLEQLDEVCRRLCHK
ncbi:MAG: ParB/RepB/Spo0J family partition protein [Alphaproteobacteria bacterium]|nr:ParB/RepB/Spo0J family partition protein [Alphaproteobacteria bacterium]